MLLQKQTLRMWNPETDFPNANGTAITIQTSPTAEKETIVIVAVLVTCVLSLALTAVSVLLVLQRLRRMTRVQGDEAAARKDGAA